MVTGLAREVVPEMATLLKGVEKCTFFGMLPGTLITTISGSRRKAMLLGAREIEGT
jgi:hypothetical protein